MKAVGILLFSYTGCINDIMSAGPLPGEEERFSAQ